MLELILILVGAAAGGGAVAYRLKGSRTWRELGADILRGGGGGEEK
jgi:hypothetical protein